MNGEKHSSYNEKHKLLVKSCNNLAESLVSGNKSALIYIKKKWLGS
jgi:hypothetical protein